MTPTTIFCIVCYIAAGMANILGAIDRENKYKNIYNFILFNFVLWPISFWM